MWRQRARFDARIANLNFRRWAVVVFLRLWGYVGCEWTFQSRINLNIWSFAMPLLVFGSVHVAKHHSSLEDLEEAQKPSIIASRLPPCSYQIIKLSRHWSTADLLDCLMMGQILGFKSRRNQLLNVTFATKGFFPIYTLGQK